MTIRSRIAVASLTAAAACAPAFTFESNGRQQRFTGEHASLTQADGADELTVCGDVAANPGVADSGESVCIILDLDTTARGALAPRTIVHLAGTSGRDPANGDFVFMPAATHDPVVRSARLQFGCFCSTPLTQFIQGDLRLDTSESSHLAGSLALDVTADGGLGTPAQTDHIEAHFDASRP